MVASTKETPIHLAATQTIPSLILTLVARGSEVDPLDSQKRTPLHLAIDSDCLETVNSLVELGADLEAEDVN